MRKKEFIIGGLIVIIGYLLVFLINGRCLILMNVMLCVFYSLFLLGKLPDDFYRYNKLSRSTRYSIYLAFFFIAMMTLQYFVGTHDKMVGRIGIIPFFLFIIFLVQYTFIKRFFTDMPRSQFNRYLWCCLRCLLILFPYLPVISTLTYSCQSIYDGDRLLRKVVKDGRDTYETTYNDSLSMYQTTVSIKDSKIKLNYIVYYDVYPDKINHIDTIEAKK